MPPAHFACYRHHSHVLFEATNLTRSIARTVAAGAVLAGTGASSAVRADPVGDAAASAIRRLDLQAAFPHASGREPEFWSLELPDQIWWLLAAGLVGVMIYLLRDMLPGWRRAGAEEWRYDAAGPGAGSRTAADSLAAADDLAAQGRIVEAMHVLLLFSLTEIRRRLSVEFADSLTSREIVRSARLPEAGRAALDAIVARVESSYFGDHPAASADYRSCRDRFVTLQGVLESPAPA
jgi:hypothetical protein